MVSMCPLCAQNTLGRSVVQCSGTLKERIHLHVSSGVIANFKSDLCILKVKCILISFAGLES